MSLGHPSGVPGTPGGTNRALPAGVSLSPKAGHNKAGRSDIRNQRFEPDTAKMRKALLTLQKQGFEETPQSKSAENAEDAENVDAKTRMIGFSMTGFR